jgi:hypothetical protein
MGVGGQYWQDTEYVLQQFGRTMKSARKAYVEFVGDQLQVRRQPELTGGGLVRSAGRWSEVLSMRLRQAEAEEMLGRECSEKGLSVEALRAGSRSREYSAIRRELARKFVIELGLSHAEVARMPGV